MASSSHDAFRLVELFAGIGGAGIALAPAFRTVLANDNCCMKAATFRRNHPDVPLDDRSVEELRAASMPQSDLLWASFPCVDHSALGDGAGFLGGRGSLAFQVVRILGEHHLLRTLPPVACFENVARFASHDEGRDFAALVQSLVSLGYRVGAVVVDAELFLPVLRKRLFVVAVRREVAVPACMLARAPDPLWHPQPLMRAVASLPATARREWLWLSMPRPDAPVPALSDLLDDGQDHAWFDPVRTRRVLDACRPADVEEVGRMHAAGDVLAIVGAQRREGTLQLPIHVDGLVRCVTAGSARQRVLRADGTGMRIRNFSHRELGRLSGLPDGFRLPTARSSATRCVGDGLCIPVVAWLGRHVLAPLATAAREATARPGTVAAVPVPPVRKRRHAGATVRTGIKGATSALTTYLYRDDLDRLHRHASTDGVPLVEWMLRELDAVLARRGQPPLRRYVPVRSRVRGGAASGGIALPREAA